MVEKNIVLEEMNFTYDGLFDVVEFYNAVEKWMAEKNRHKDIKKKSEIVTPQGKKIEWFIECWRDETHVHRTIVRLHALMDHVTEAIITKNKAKKRLNKGKVLIRIDGLLETDWEGKWQQEPMYTFVRAVIDRFFKQIHFDLYHDRVIEDAKDLFNTLKGFFNLYRY